MVNSLSIDDGAIVVEWEQSEWTSLPSSASLWVLSTGERKQMMALTSHLAELSEKHKLLEKRLEQARAHPSVDTLEITHLKREKLKLKDEILRLQHTTMQH